jgi:uncharacterized membrane protein
MPRKLTAVFFLVLLVTAASATTIDSEKVEIDLESSTVDVEMEVGDLTSQRFTYFTNHNDLELLNATIDGKPVDCTVERTQIESTVSCPTDLRENFSVHLKYRTETLTDTAGQQRLFNYRKNFIRPTNDFTVKVILPPGNVLLEEGNVTTPVVSPTGGSIGSDGQRISVGWSMDPSLGESQVFQVIYKDSGNTGTRLEIEAMLLGGAGVLTVIILGYYTYRRMNRESLDTVYESLGEDEKKLLEMIRENGGEMLQKDAVAELDYSKAKVSGIVSGLTEKGILDKEKEGRSNKLTISNGFKF